MVVRSIYICLFLVACCIEIIHDVNDCSHVANNILFMSHTSHQNSVIGFLVAYTIVPYGTLCGIYFVLCYEIQIE